uniref:Uncharacterized protein n=1 Tax=Brassica oleracea TaxID=3712 RepID=A0A3P6BV75_BRAOL|nr:unnamed protein product [Brassica oleracea]
MMWRGRKKLNLRIFARPTTKNSLSLLMSSVVCLLMLKS